LRCIESSDDATEMLVGSHCSRSRREQHACCNPRTGAIRHRRRAVRTSAVLTAPSHGTVFVSDGHSRNRSNNARVVKYSPDGAFIKAWGRLGEAPGDFREPHDIAIGGSRGYVYVADRN
jgi:hypothetical protein